LLREPVKPEHLKSKVVGHWGTIPKQNFVYEVWQQDNNG
jgi:xylulose-5-phosphate/fructose-6-phosphate phosphoketolase